MLAKVKETIDAYGLLQAGDGVVVGVSGGPDSVALLLSLHRLAPEYGIRLHVACLNHMMRPRAAQEEAAFVSRLAQELGLPVTIACRDVPTMARQGKKSLEEAARQARYAFLEEVAGRVGASKIAVGHQADDQVETILLHLLYGAGTAGLGAMSYRRGRVIRPLLAVTREEILAFLAGEGHTYCLDSSNLDTDYRRNHIRHRLLPFLEKEYNPRVREVLWRTAEIIREENSLLESLTRRAWSECLRHEATGTVELSARVLASLAPALQRRVLRLAYSRLLGEGKSLPFHHVEAIRSRLGVREAAWQLPLGVQARLHRGRLRLQRQSLPRGEISFCRRLAVPGSTPLPRGGVLETSVLPGEALSRIDWKEVPAHEAYADLGEPRPQLFVRYRRPGDSFYPLGLGGRKKIHDFFVDAKVPQELRDTVPLVTTATDIVWVAGLRLDARWQVRAETSCAVHFRFIVNQP
ncbi:MAG: tRNA lysidine(34) synthetase TilS [Clostridia bacterium]|nr:MAG: tRNA lysidine(34) synthetase TilS [Clostridia bacterium]